MTQLGELRDSYPKLREAGIRLYAISYDDREVLTEFARAHAIPFPLLSDVDSEVIDAYGIRNRQCDGMGPLEGIPYPGTYLCDEDGVVIEKYFFDTYKRRHNAEDLVDRALGRILLGDAEPSTRAGGEDVRISATLHGGTGALRQGVSRRVVVRFELADGLHLYGEPVPDGMFATTVSVTGPPGLVVQPPVYPPTQTLRLKGLDVELNVWSGSVDVAVPVYAQSTLASECRPLDETSAELVVEVRYQACDDTTCLLPKTEMLTLQVPIEPIEVPTLGMHMGHGQLEATFDGEPHMRRLMRRKLRRNPLGLPKLLWRTLVTELGARRRQRGGS